MDWWIKKKTNFLFKIQVFLEILRTKKKLPPADDLTDPAPATTFQHLGATTVLSRKVNKVEQ